MAIATRDEILERVRSMGFWFHNIDLGQGVYTCPDHPYGDFPNYKWQMIEAFIPEDLSGKTVLDIGCNAGFYSFETKKRGADRVLALDVDERYLNQARFAAEVLDLDVEFRKMSVYDIDELKEQFDYVLFLGVLYHLRYPLYALDKAAMIVRERLIAQSLIRGETGEMELADNYLMTDREIFDDPRFPRMFFVEKSYVHDPSNWWIPNEAGLAAMLRSSGLRTIAHPDVETFVCEPIEGFDRWWMGGEGG